MSQLFEENVFEEWQPSDMICNLQIGGVGKEKYCIATVNRLGQKVLYARGDNSYGQLGRRLAAGDNPQKFYMMSG